jgi:hypothetical protein
MSVFDLVWRTVRGAPVGTFAIDKTAVLEIVKGVLRDKPTRVEMLAALRELKIAVPRQPAPIPTKRTHEISLVSAPEPQPAAKRQKTLAEEEAEEDMRAIKFSMELRESQLAERVKELEEAIKKAAGPPPPPRPVSEAAGGEDIFIILDRPQSPPPVPTFAAAAEDEPACDCCMCTSSDLRARGLGGLQPIIVGCDPDSPSRCTHMTCQECADRARDVFLADPETPMLKCVGCEKANAPIRRRFLDASICQYIVDPSTFAFGLTKQQRDNLRRKSEYLRAISGTVTGLYREGEEDKIQWDEARCPSCDHPAAGPITRACPNLGRCKSLKCLTIFCAYCTTAETHDHLHCPTLLRLKRIRTTPFDPKDGRTCPYPGCTGVCIQHYRDDGCHIVNCWVCGRRLCFVCGNPKSGDEHHAFNGRTCSCKVYCDDNCPCIVAPATRPAPPRNSLPPAAATAPSQAPQAALPPTPAPQRSSRFFATHGPMRVLLTPAPIALPQPDQSVFSEGQYLNLRDVARRMDVLFDASPSPQPPPPPPRRREDSDSDYSDED